MIDDTVRISRTRHPASEPGTAGGLTYPPRTYRPARKLLVEFDPRAVGILGGYVTRDHGKDVFTWSPLPGVAIRWGGELRTPGVVLGCAAVLSTLAGIPSPWNAVLAVWLAFPAGAALWHAWLRGRLW